MEAYSPDTDTTYPSWEALVEAEANGWVAVAVITQGAQSWPWVRGPYPTKREASNARSRLRAKWKREMQTHPAEQTVKLFVRPAWKDGL